MDIEDLTDISEIDTDDLCEEISTRTYLTQRDKYNLLSVLDEKEDDFDIKTMNDQIKYELIVEAFNKYSLAEIENKLK